jgi:hypothetical protein
MKLSLGKGKGKKFSHYRPEQALEDSEIKAPDFLDFRHCEGAKEFSCYSFLEAESTPGRTVPSVALEKKIPSDATGDRSRDPPTGSAEPLPLRYPRPQLSLGLFQFTNDMALIR